MTGSSSSALNLQDVRKLAREEGLSEAYWNETSRVVSFAQPGEEVHRVRFNVYYTTGTVGTCINHPNQGRTQLFRRNVTMDELKLIFQNPRIHTGIGYHRKDQLPPETSARKRIRLTDGSALSTTRPISLFPVGCRAYVSGYANCTVLSDVLEDYHGLNAGKVHVRYDDGTEYHVRPQKLEKVMEEVVDEETAAKEQLTRLKQELERLEGAKKDVEEQMFVVQNVLESFETQRRLQAEAERRAKQAEAERQKQAEMQAKRVERGNDIDFWIEEPDFVSEIFNETVTCISCAGETTIMLYEDGGWACTAGLTTNLYNKLNGRQKSLPKPRYVSIGSQDRYYVDFANGASQWVGCEDMSEVINENNHRDIASVAFGEDWDSYFVVFKDGWWTSKNIPPGLSDILGRRQCRADLSCVSLGPNGEYYVSAKNGRAWWGGMSPKVLKHVARFEDRISFLDFGAEDSYLLRYS